MSRSCISICAGLLYLYAAVLSAAPSVTSVQWVNDTSFRVSGGSFGIKVPAEPEYWADFETTDKPIPPGLNVSWPKLDESQGVRATSVRRGKNTGVLRGDVSIDEGAKGPLISKFVHDQWYIFYKRYYDFDISVDGGVIGFNLKTNRMWSDFFGGGAPWGNNIYIGYQGAEGINSGRTFNEYTNVQGATRGFSFYPRVWHTDQIVYKTSDLDVQNGIFSYVRDGVSVWSENRRWRTNDSERPNKYNQIVFDQVSNGTGSGPLYIYYDDIYIDKTWARVMLCESQTWAECKQHEIQIPVVWSDKEITLNVNFGDLNPDVSAYVYVVDESGAVNQNGVKLPCITCAPFAIGAGKFTVE